MAKGASKLNAGGGKFKSTVKVESPSLYETDYTQNEDAKSALQQVKTVVNDIIKDDSTQYRIQNEVDRDGYPTDPVWNSIHDSYPLSLPDDEGVKVVRVKGNDIITVAISVDYSYETRSFLTYLKPIIYSKNSFSKEELEYMGIE